MKRSEYIQALEKIADDETKRIKETFNSERTLTGTVGAIQDALIGMPKSLCLAIGQLLEESGAVTFDPDDPESPS